MPGAQRSCSNKPAQLPFRLQSHTAVGARPLAHLRCRYESLAAHYPDVPEYRLHWCQSLDKAGMSVEASRGAAGVEGFAQAVRLLNCAIKYEQVRISPPDQRHSVGCLRHNTLLRLQPRTAGSRDQLAGKLARLGLHAQQQVALFRPSPPWQARRRASKQPGNLLH